MAILDGSQVSIGLQDDVHVVPESRFDCNALTPTVQCANGMENMSKQTLEPLSEEVCVCMH